VFFDYKFIERLGHGSFGVVYEAENVRDGKTNYLQKCLYKPAF
jgi:serine/threonine protein kinase